MGDYRGTFNNNLLLISTTTEMRINFISDSSVAKAGFEATFKQGLQTLIFLSRLTMLQKIFARHGRAVLRSPWLRNC